MAVTLAVGPHWDALLDRLAEALRELALGPFDSCRVVVATRETGRIVSQDVASRLGISAGVSYLTPADLLRELAEAAGVSEDRNRWLGSPLDLAVQQVLPEVAEHHPLLAASLAADAGRPGRRRATAVRLAQLMRTYLDLAPDLVAAWLGGGEADATGAALPELSAWQPDLLRASTERLEVDPVDIVDALCIAAGADSTPTIVLAVDDVPEPVRRVLATLAAGRGLDVIQPVGGRGIGWAAPLATRTVALAGAPRTPPRIDVHDSHGEARQVEVLRDELTRAFAEDPTLEPRQVAIVCPQPERFAPLLDTAFAPGDAHTHPGRRLRVHPIGRTQANPLLELLVDLLRIDSSRATARGLTELLLRPPVAHRWGFLDRSDLVELIAGAGIRWGLDTGHRAQFGLGDVGQNTWVRGLDRLLVGLTVAFDDDAGLGLSGAEAVTSSDMATVGSLCEVISRLRRMIALTADPATVPVWTARCRDALDTLVAVPREDEWQLSATARTLSRLEADHASDETVLPRHEFSLLLADAATGWRRRAAAGNGGLAVLPLGELPHVGFRLVAMIGVTDDAVPGRSGLPADCVELGGGIADPRTRRRAQLLDHATAAERLLIVRQARSQRTNDTTALPVAVDWLLDELGGGHVTVDHPPTATSAANFPPERPSFDSAGHAGALAHLGNTSRRERAIVRRRVAARTRPVGPPPVQVSIDQLTRFLTNPAKSFLQSAAGIGMYRDPDLTDEIPLVAGGLERWKVRSELLDAWRSGTSGEAIEEAIRLRETFPPLAIGRKAFLDTRAQAMAMWERAAEDWAAARSAVAVNIPVEVPGLGVVTLLDEVTTHGGVAVTMTASTGGEQLIRPWLEALALAACGRPAPARLHRFVSWYGDLRPETRDVHPQDPAEALERLAVVIRAFTLGQHRLVPVPAVPAIRLVEEHRHQQFKAAEWAGDMNSYGSKWAWPDDAWLTFFESDVSELFADHPLPEDPVTGHESAFESWAHALYGPMIASAS